MEKINYWDLRIGNVISFNGGLYRVDVSIRRETLCIIEHDKFDFTDYPCEHTYHGPYRAVCSVPATKENLEAIGIKFPIMNNVWIIDYTIDKNILIFRKDSGGKLEIHDVKFIHEIQNIILDLTKIRI